MDATTVILLCLLVAIVTAAAVSHASGKSQDQIQAELLLEEAQKESIRPVRDFMEGKLMTTWRDPETGNTLFCTVDEAMQKQNAYESKGNKDIDSFVTDYVDGLLDDDELAVKHGR